MVTAKSPAPWRSEAELAEAALEAGDKMRTVPPNEAERIQIRNALIEGGVPERDLDWMTASCPSLRTARRFYPKRNP